ncbi:MAG: c-type cytochrome [Pyrinomonadaceae bacterium]
MKSAMPRLMLSIAFAFLFAFPLLVFMLGAEPSVGAQSKSGKDLYKQNCRVCHEKNSANGEYTPMSLTQDQWTSFYKNKLIQKHKEVRMPSQETKLLDALTSEQLKAIEKFCIDHAADSEQPQTCSGD